MARGPVYRLRDVVKTRPAPGIEFRLVVPQFEIAAGEVLVLAGASGCGKSTLLDLLAMTLQPSEAGSFEFTPPRGEAVDLGRFWREGRVDALTRLRGRHLGYVLQTGGLLPFLTVRDNVALSRRLLGLPIDDTVPELAERLGFAVHLDKRPSDLSVGERQRVAIARALAHRPAVVLADEPTASVDPATADTILELLLDLVARFGTTAIIASHDWMRIEELGLRRVEHELVRRPGVTESRFWR